MIIQAISIKKTIGGNPLFEDLSCQIEAGEKIALVGINGTGKSTFLQILTTTTCSILPLRYRTSNSK